MTLLVSTAGTLTTAAITGGLAVLGSLVVAYIASRTTLMTRADDTYRDITARVVEDGTRIRAELWERFEEADVRERQLGDRMRKQEDENRELHWQIDRLKADHAVEAKVLSAEIERLKADHAGEVQRLMAEIERLKAQIVELLAEIGRLKDGTAS